MKFHEYCAAFALAGAIDALLIVLTLKFLYS